MLSTSLSHHGIKGQKWGVRRFQNYDGSMIIKKGTVVKRVSTDIDDKTYDNKKYVSVNQKDHSKWESYLGEAYLNRGRTTYSHTYATNKDLRILSREKQGELYVKMLLDAKFKDQAIKDTEYANTSLNQKSTSDMAENISRNIAMQTATGKAFVKEVLKENYGAIYDTHGTNVSDNPLIILNPDENLSKYSDPEYSQPVKDYLKRRYGIKS